MGLLFNSTATVEMLAKVNKSFNSNGIKRWRRKNRIRYFDDASGDPQKLDEVVDSENIFPDSGQDAPEGKKWTAWLQYLHDGSQGGAGDKIRGFILEGLKDPKCAEIAFVVLPSTNAVITATMSKFPTLSANPYLMLVTINTPTVVTILARLKALKARRKKKR